VRPILRLRLIGLNTGKKRLTKEVNRPNRRPAKEKRREIEAHVEGNQIVAVGSELNARLGSGARLRKAGADECSGDAALTTKNRAT